jgi:hypothetical protein
VGGASFEMKRFVVNGHGRLVFPSNFSADLDFSVLATLAQLEVVIKRDFEAKALTRTEILERADANAPVRPERDTRLETSVRRVKFATRVIRRKPSPRVSGRRPEGACRPCGARAAGPRKARLGQVTTRRRLPGDLEGSGALTARWLLVAGRGA